MKSLLGLVRLNCLVAACALALTALQAKADTYSVNVLNPDTTSYNVAALPSYAVNVTQREFDTLLLFATGLVVMGLLGWRRKQREIAHCPACVSTRDFLLCNMYLDFWPAAVYLDFWPAAANDSEPHAFCGAANRRRSHSNLTGDLTGRYATNELQPKNFAHVAHAFRGSR
jgi:hypothetical protein